VGQELEVKVAASETSTFQPFQARKGVTSKAQLANRLATTALAFANLHSYHGTPNVALNVMFQSIESLVWRFGNQKGHMVNLSSSGRMGASRQHLERQASLAMFRRPKSCQGSFQVFLVEKQ
jgi:hypothetical protein